MKKNSLFRLEDLLIIGVTVASLGVVGWAVGESGAAPTVSSESIVTSADERPSFELPPVSHYDCEPVLLARDQARSRLLAGSAEPMIRCRPKI